MRKRCLVFALLAGCKGYDRDRFLAVCSDGTGYDATAAYDPAAAPTPYPLAIVHKSARHGWYVNTPTPFQAATAAPSADNYKDISLALCVEQQPGPFARDCDMDSFDSTMELGNGDPKVTVQKSARGSTKIKAFASHYVLTMREAKTGVVVASKTLDVAVEHCPLITLGDSAEDYVEISDEALLSFAASALPKPVAARLRKP
jgi:hypothetical protein